MFRIARHLICAWLATSSTLQLASAAEITRLWLSHRSNDPSKVVINWQSPKPGNAVVRYGVESGPMQTVAVEENSALHHVEIDCSTHGVRYRYEVQTGDDRSQPTTLKSYPRDVLRVAVVADWQGKPKLDGIARDDVHLLLTCGDNINSLHEACGYGGVGCTEPYGRLIDAYPELFRSTPFMPSLGNHDREIRPRGPKPPPEPVYDVDATAFRKFFELPGDEWIWHLDMPAFDVRFAALDLNHIQDLGTTWQTCHSYDRASPQFQWFDHISSETGRPKFLVTLHNEKSSAMRSQEKSAWHEMFRRGTIAVTGFGYFAERAEVDGFSYYNTALGAGAKYPDPKSQFFAAQASYLLLTYAEGRMTAELKSLDGAVLDRKEFAVVK